MKQRYCASKFAMSEPSLWSMRGLPRQRRHTRGVTGRPESQGRCKAADELPGNLGSPASSVRNQAGTGIGSCIDQAHVRYRTANQQAHALRQVRCNFLSTVHLAVSRFLLRRIAIQFFESTA